MKKNPSKKVLYRLLQETIDDVGFHIDTSVGLLDREELEKAIIRCERAMAAIRNAKKEIDRNRDDISAQKMSCFEKCLDEMQHRLWRVANKINTASKEKFYHYKKAKNLRLHFLAYSYNPSSNMEDSFEKAKIS
jgi:hypothetical protein